MNILSKRGLWTLASAVVALGLAAAPVWAKGGGGHGGGGHGGGGHGGGHGGEHHGGSHHSEHHHSSEHHHDSHHHADHHDDHHDHHHDDHHGDHHHYHHNHYYVGGWGWGPGWGWAGAGAAAGYNPNYYNGLANNYNAPAANVNDNNEESDASDNASINDTDEDNVVDAEDTSISATPPADRGLIRIKLPVASAVVTFDGQKILGSGSERAILTPQMEPGHEYRFQVMATWTEGSPITEVREGTITAGDTVTADFTSGGKFARVTAAD